MPMPGYSHYFLSKHLAQENLRKNARRGQVMPAVAADPQPAREKAIIALMLIALPIMGIALIALSYGIVVCGS